MSLLSSERNICFHTNAHEQSRCTESCQVVSDTRGGVGMGSTKSGTALTTNEFQLSSVTFITDVLNMVSLIVVMMEH